MHCDEFNELIHTIIDKRQSATRTKNVDIEIPNAALCGKFAVQLIICPTAALC